MSATDTSQLSSDFLKSSRMSGDFELNSWTQGLGGAPRPNPVPASAVSSQAPNLSAQNPHSLSTNLNATGINLSTTNRYTQSNPGLRYDQKLSSSNQAPSTNPFLGSPSMGQGGDNRQEPRANLREAWNQAQTPDLQSFDLSSYVQTQTRPSATSASRDFLSTKTDPNPVPGGFSGGGFNDWGHQSGTSQENTQHQAAFDQLSVADSTSGGGDLEDYDADGNGGIYESRFANKKILISAVLIGALVAGGGVSYLYNSFFGSDSDGPTPIVKNAQGPSKVKPSDPGGKQFAHSDSKILGRLNDASTTTEADPSAETRKVSTLVVGRDGAIQPSSASETQNASPTVSVPVPGLTLIDGAAPNGKTASSSTENSISEGTKSAEVKVSDKIVAKEGPQSETIPQSKGSQTDNGVQTAAVSTSPSPSSLISQPQISSVSNKSTEPSQISKSNTETSSSSEGNSKSTLTDADLQQPSSQKKLASGISQPASEETSFGTKPKTEVKTAALEPSSKTPRTQLVKPNGMGYVAVLASVPASGNSRIVALQQYADLQQKYNAILQNKTPDVQEANLGEKGRYHRLIIGPPGSKEAANSICAQLKSAGYSSCWIMVY